MISKELEKIIELQQQINEVAEILNKLFIYLNILKYQNLKKELKQQVKILAEVLDN